MKITPEFIASLKTKVSSAKREGIEWQKRRWPEWTENYSFYRDKVSINRLVQRQSVNVPLMKQSIKTILAKIDDVPDIYFDCLEDDDQKEIYVNEMFKDDMKRNRMRLKDVVDKKQVCIYGRSFKKLNILDGRFHFDIVEPQDVVVSRFIDPTSLESSYFLTHLHIFKTLSEVKENDLYDKDAIARIEEFFATKQGVATSSENSESLRAKNDRLRQMGAQTESPEVGQTIVEVNETYIMLWDEEENDSQYFLVVTVQDEVVYVEALEKVIGVLPDHFWRKNLPFTSWAEDLDRADFWSDAPADVIRTPNKVSNSTISQMVENRTLRNYGMMFYNSKLSKEGFVPQTFIPRPFGWYPVPGNPNEVMKNVEVPDLSESIDEMNFVIGLAEKATAATSIQQGVSEARKITLGEVQILDQNANERITAMSLFYTESWAEFGLKYIKMMEAAADKLAPITLYKKSFKGHMFEKTLHPKEWKSKKGWNVRVTSKAEMLNEQLDQIQKLNAATNAMPDNVPLKKIYNSKILDIAGLTPDEKQEVLDFEKKKYEAPVMDAEIIPDEMLDPTGMPELPATAPLVPPQI